MSLAADITETLDRDALAEAVEKAGGSVRDEPSNVTARNLLIDVLILQGDYERADKQCALAAKFSPDVAVGFARLRGELRGMAARQAFFEEGAVPEFPGEPTACDTLALRLAVASREGELEETQALLAALEDARGLRPMKINDRITDDLRDCDDRIPHALEAISSGGGYLWIDFAKITSLSLKPMSRPRDIAYRDADLTLVDGSSGTVVIPMIYHETSAQASIRLGRETLWEEAPSGITIGRGQRCFLAGDALLPSLELETIESLMPAVTNGAASHG